MKLYLESDDPTRSVLVDAGRIAAVGVGRPDDAEIVDCRGAVVAPGFVNAHTHLYGGLAPLGMPSPEPPPTRFVEILERVWWRLDRALDERSLRAAARLYVAEALLFGTTTLVDHHESPGFIEGSLDVLADACEELGIRALLCYGATERNGGREEARRGLAECRRFVSSNGRENVRGLVGLHASFTVSDETIREAGALAAELGTVVHVHVAEDRADVDDARRRGYDGPLERLARLGALPAGSILAHGVHLERRDVETAAAERLWIVQNPRSNRHNGVGYPRFLWASDRVALGTDGFPSDLLAEETELFRAAPEHGPEEARASARRLDAGHRLVGERFGDVFGAVEVGAVADLAVMPQAAEERPVLRHALVGGRLVVEDGVLVAADIEEIRARAREEAPALWKRMERL